MGEVWPTALITELCLQLTAGSGPQNRDEDRALGSQSCARALLTSDDSPVHFSCLFHNLYLVYSVITAYDRIPVKRDG